MIAKISVHFSFFLLFMPLMITATSQKELVTKVYKNTLQGRIHLSKAHEFSFVTSIPTTQYTRDTRDTRQRVHGEQLVRDIENILEEFVEKLKIFISGTGFQIDKFLLHEPMLSKELARVSIWIESTKNHKGLNSRLRFPTQMFRAMKQAVGTIRYFGYNYTAQVIIRKLVHLNLILLKLHNWHGEVDLSNPDFVNTVTSLERCLISWRSTYEKLRRVGFTTQIMFDSQFKRASRTIEYMKAHFPK